MSPTLEKVKPTRRSRLERIDAALVEDEAKLAAARAKIAELTAAEDEAVLEAKRRDPSANPFALREPAQVARAEREKLARSLDGISKGIAALRAERVTAEREQAAARLAEYAEDARNFLAREREARLAAGKALAQLAERWNQLAPILSKRSELVARVRGERLVELVGAESEVAGQWHQVAGFAVEPVPLDLRAFVAQLVDAALGERRDLEAERREIDVQNRRRAAFSQNQRLDPEGKPLALADDDLGPNPGRDLLPPLAYPPGLTDSERELVDLVPDLRDSAAAEVSDVATRRSGPAAGEARWPDQAA